MSTSKRWVRRAAISFGENTLISVAASSSARGMPSSMPQRRATSRQLERVSRKSGVRARTRSSQSRTLGTSATSSGSLEGTGVGSGCSKYEYSPKMGSLWREVVRQERSGTYSRQRPDHQGAVGQQMLHPVQHQQHRPVGERVDQPLPHSRPRAQRDGQRRSQAEHDLIGLRQAFERQVTDLSSPSAQPLGRRAGQARLFPRRPCP